MPPFAVLRSPRAFSPHKSAKKGKTPLHFRRTGDILSKLSLSGCGSVWSRALRSGRKSRRFKSSHPDHFFARVPLKNRPRYSMARMQDALAPGRLRFAFPALSRLPIFPTSSRSARHSLSGGAVASLRLGFAVWLSLVWSVAFGTQKSEVQILSPRPFVVVTEF